MVPASISAAAPLKARTTTSSRWKRIPALTICWSWVRWVWAQSMAAESEPYASACRGVPASIRWSSRSRTVPSGKGRSWWRWTVRPRPMGACSRPWGWPGTGRCRSRSLPLLIPTIITSLSTGLPASCRSRPARYSGSRIRRSCTRKSSILGWPGSTRAICRSPGPSPRMSGSRSRPNSWPASRMMPSGSTLPGPNRRC